MLRSIKTLNVVVHTICVVAQRKDDNFFPGILSWRQHTSAPLTWLKQNGCYSGREGFCVLELAKTNSVTLEQRLFRRRYGKSPSTRQSIYDWSKKFQKTGCLCKGNSSGRPPVSEDRIRLSYWYLSCDKRLTHRTFVTSSYKLKNMYYKTM